MANQHEDEKFVNPIKFGLAEDRITPEHIKVLEVEADEAMKGPVGHAFEMSFESMVNSMMMIPPHEKEKIVAAQAQLRSLVFVYEYLKEMVVTNKIRLADEARKDEMN